jgi:cytochrome P450
MDKHELYQKPLLLRRLMGRYMREGLLIAEGHRWRVQRKVVQKSFGKGNIRGMEKIVVEKAEQVGPALFTIPSSRLILARTHTRACAEV